MQATVTVQQSAHKVFDVEVGPLLNFLYTWVKVPLSKIFKQTSLLKHPYLFGNDI